MPRVVLAVIVPCDGRCTPDMHIVCSQLLDDP